MIINIATGPAPADGSGVTHEANIPKVHEERLR